MKRSSSKDYTKSKDDYTFVPIDLRKSGYLPRPGSADSYAKLIDMIERGQSPAFSKKKSSSSEFQDALEGSDNDEINELFEKLKVKEEKSKLKNSLRNTTKKNRKSKSTSEYDPVYSLVFDKQPEKLKEVTKAFQKIDDIKKYPSLLSITMSSTSNKSKKGSKGSKKI